MAELNGETNDARRRAIETGELFDAGVGAPPKNFAGKFARKATRGPWFYTIVALVGGIIGGALTNRMAATIPAFAADTPAQSIAARQIMLVDARGNSRAVLHLNREGLPMLQLFDDGGKPRVGLGFVHDGTVGIDLADRKGVERALLSVNSEGVPALRLYDAGARPRMLAGVDSQGYSALNFYDAEGKLLRELP
jgi:hypothetical protein